MSVAASLHYATHVASVLSMSGSKCVVKYICSKQLLVLNIKIERSGYHCQFVA